MLAEKLLGLAETLSPAERDNLKLLCGMAAGHLAPDDATATDSDEFAAYTVVASCLARLQPHRDRVPENGIAFRGSIPLIDATLLQKLQTEACQTRSEAIPHDDHFLGCGGPIANQLALSEELLKFVETVAGPVNKTGTASYIYYDEGGQYICPHIDTDVFSLNTLIMLKHSSSTKKTSYLELYPAGSEKITVDLDPGEVIVFWADSVVHGRTPVSGDEQVNIVTIGYRPVLA